MEEWRYVPGFEGRYQVSNKGNVKSLNYKGTKKEKILRLAKTWNGYIQIVLGKIAFRVHRLVWGFNQAL